MWNRGALLQALPGVQILYNTWWVRHTRAPIGQATGDSVQDACGPEEYLFPDLLREIAVQLQVRPPVIWPLPLPACGLLYRLVGQVLRDTVLSGDEPRGLAAGCLASSAPPLGATPLSVWLAAHRDTLGLRFRPEPRRVGLAR